MKNQINTTSGQVYQYGENSFIQLLNPCSINPNPAYNQDGSMNYWDAKWFNYENGKLVQSKDIQKVRMDGFMNPQLCDSLPKDKVFFFKNKSAGGCTGHRYSTDEIVVTETGNVVGTISHQEYKDSYATIYGINYNYLVPNNVIEDIIKNYKQHS